MGEKLARNTGALLMELASDCDHIQNVIGALLDRMNDPARDGDVDASALRDLQGLDRIAQLLRDVAAVQQALSRTGISLGDTGAQAAVNAARLEETRTALAGRNRVRSEATRPACNGDTIGDCQFF